MEKIDRHKEICEKLNKIYTAKNKDYGDSFSEGFQEYGLIMPAIRLEDKCNIKKRTIMIFPQFKNINIINEIRKKYDPLANHVCPHITLVFTFESSLTSVEIKEYLKKVLEGTSRFRLTLQEIVKIDNPLGMYLFLDIKQGNEQIKEMSKKLYAGILNNYKPVWLNEETFMPHMTIGNFTSKEDLDIAFKNTELIKEEFTTIVDKISVEIIDKNEDSIIEVEVDLINE